MDTYATILLWVIPGFLILVLIEVLYGYYIDKQTYTLMEHISILMSELTYIVQNSMGIILLIISYWFMEKVILILHLNST